MNFSTKLSFLFLALFATLTLVGALPFFGGDSPYMGEDSIVPEFDETELLMDGSASSEVPPTGKGKGKRKKSAEEDNSCGDVSMSALNAAMKAQSVAGLPAACGACLMNENNDGCGIQIPSEESDPCDAVCGPDCTKPADEYDPTKDCKKCGECHRAMGSGAVLLQRLPATSALVSVGKGNRKGKKLEEADTAKIPEDDWENGYNGDGDGDDSDTRPKFPTGSGMPPLDDGYGDGYGDFPKTTLMQQRFGRRGGTMPGGSWTSPPPALIQKEGLMSEEDDWDTGYGEVPPTGSGAGSEVPPTVKGKGKRKKVASLYEEDGYGDGYGSGYGSGDTIIKDWASEMDGQKVPPAMEDPMDKVGSATTDEHGNTASDKAEMDAWLPLIHQCQAKLAEGDVCKTLDPESCAPDPPPANCEECKDKLTPCVKSLMQPENTGSATTTETEGDDAVVSAGWNPETDAEEAKEFLGGSTAGKGKGKRK